MFSAVLLERFGAIADEPLVSPTQITEEQREQAAREALFRAFKVDLPLGFEFMRDLAARVEQSSEPIEWSVNPKSELGQQLARLHSDVARDIISERLFKGAPLRFYNCCNGSAAQPKNPPPVVSAIKQIQAQTAPDC